MNAFKAIKTAEADRVARLTLARPPLNVLNIAMIGELNDYVSTLADRRDLCALVIRGEGDNFCAGVDVPEHRADTVRAMLGTFHEFFRRLYRLPFPTVCGVQGGAYGGGMEVACFCDITVGADDLKIGVPEVTLGVFPPVAVAQLSSRVGAARAAEMIFTGRVVDADEALRMGLVSRVCAVTDLDEEVDKVAGKLARLSSYTLRHTRAAFRQAVMPDFEEILAEAEACYLDSLMKGDDPQEGLLAFMEKRKPRWQDR